MKKKLIVVMVLILMASLIPHPLSPALASGESRLDGGYTNVTDLRDGWKHIEMSAEVVVVVGDLRIDSGDYYDVNYPARYVFEEDGVIRSLFLMYGGGNSFARPNFFAAITVEASNTNAIKIDYAHIPVGDYQHQKNGELWFNDWNFPVKKGDIVWILLWVKKLSPEGDTWWGGRTVMLFEPTKYNKGK